jgi:hypothetical protein
MSVIALERSHPKARLLPNPLLEGGRVMFRCGRQQPRAALFGIERTDLRKLPARSLIVGDLYRLLVSVT